jgi:hypothetical protein
MHDWNALVRERLGGLNLPEAEREETIAELASHLLECYESQLREGLSDAEAVQCALHEIGDGERLARRIHRVRREERNMADRMRTFWLPGLVSLAAFNVLWMIITRVEIVPHLLDFGFIVVPVYLPLLLAMPLFGALGAYLSTRAGGSRRARVAAGVFPLIALPAAALTAVGASFLSLISLSPTPHQFPTQLFVAIVVLCGFAVQSAALLLGALPFLRAEHRASIE